jgi:rare lipoprotein A
MLILNTKTLKATAFVTASLSFLLLQEINTECNAAQVEHTKASFYGGHFAGKKTASGKRFNPNGMTAASNHLPLGSQVLVKNLKTGKNVKVTITDRGPGCRGRGIDLSKGAAQKIGMKGVAPVSVKPLKIASKPHK